MPSCTRCSGSGAIMCISCGGSTRNPADETQSCPTCAGRGSIDCTACGGSGTTG